MQYFKDKSKFEKACEIDTSKILGISEKATVEAVKKAYRKFAKKNHPDIYPGDKVREDIFKQVTSAYHKWLHIEHNIDETKEISAHPRESMSAFAEHRRVKEYEKAMEMVYDRHIGNRKSVHDDVRPTGKVELYA